MRDVDAQFGQHQRHGGIIEQAKHKEGGLSEFWLAGMFRQAETLQRFPATIMPVTLETIKHDYAQLAAELMRGRKPLNRRSAA